MCKEGKAGKKNQWFYWVWALVSWAVKGKEKSRFLLSLSTFLLGCEEERKIRIFIESGHFSLGLWRVRSVLVLCGAAGRFLSKHTGKLLLLHEYTNIFLSWLSLLQGGRGSAGAGSAELPPRPPWGGHRAAHPHQDPHTAQRTPTRDSQFPH